MTYQRHGELRYLYRVVTTDGAASVQGLLLGAASNWTRWLSSLVARHTVPGVQLRVVSAELAAQNCVAWRRLEAPLDDQTVCATTLGAQPHGSENWQFIAVGALFVLVAASSWARTRAQLRAEELAQLERTFVASVSHELRTPITTLRMHAEMLQEGWVSAPRRTRVLQQLVSESVRLSRLIEDVLTFGRLADGRAQLHLETADLAAKLRTLLSRELPSLAERNVEVHPQGLEGASLARYDATALEQIVLNLLENVAKYGRSPDGIARVHIALLSVGKTWTLKVQDEGPGIPEQEGAHVFEHFYRGRKALGSHVAGTGLGLAIVRGLSRAMGGDARLLPSASGCHLELELPRASDGEDSMAEAVT